jgi:diguanylate cyclase (GGDEF)-like protein
MMDIDYFKTINDTCRHIAGDGVLTEISSILKSGMRKIDTASRFGGEEFVVILPRTVKEKSLTAAERIRHAVEQHTFEGFCGKVTVSCGIAGMPDAQADSEEKLIGCADFALYRAKQLGRNRTIAAEVCELAYREA